MGAWVVFVQHVVRSSCSTPVAAVLFAGDELNRRGRLRFEKHKHMSGGCSHCKARVDAKETSIPTPLAKGILAHTFGYCVY